MSDKEKKSFLRFILSGESDLHEALPGDPPAPADGEEKTQEKARGRVQTRTPFFASARARLDALLDAIADLQDSPLLTYDWLDGALFGRDGQEGSLAGRLSPGAWAALAGAASLLLLGLWGEMAALLSLSGVTAVLLSLLGTLVCILLPAALGLLTTRQGRAFRRMLTAEQRTALYIAGVTLVCPVTLLAQLPSAAMARFGVSMPAQAAQALPGNLLLPTLLVSGLIAPACEELFCRRMVLGALRTKGAAAAALGSALVFSLMHGVGNMPLYLLLGLLFAAVTLRADALAAGFVLHSLYNICLILISFSGLGGLFGALTPASCMLRLAGSAVFVSAMQRFWRARRMAEGQKKHKKVRLRAGGILLIVSAAAALIAAALWTGGPAA